jgi:hypothetical protein
MAELVGVDHRVDRLDHAFGHVEPEHADHPAVCVVDHGPRLAVDPGQPEGGVEHPAAAEQAEQEPQDPVPPGQRAPNRLRLAAAIPVEDDVGRDHAKQRAHVAARGRLEEPARELLPGGPSGRGRRDIARLPSGGDALARPREDLPAVRLGLAGDRGDLRVAVPERLTQHEHRPLGR